MKQTGNGRIKFMCISIHEFLEAAKELQNSENKKWVFRGFKEARFECVTSFARVLAELPQKTLDSSNFANNLPLWHRLLVDTIKEVSGKMDINDKTVWSFVQHFHEKTNLLDVTKCPKIALAFATNFRKKPKNPCSENICKVIAFNLTENLKDKKQDDGYCVSLVDPCDIVFPGKKSQVSPTAFASNERIKAQKGAFLYCNRHLFLEGNPEFEFENGYKDSITGKLFDYSKYLQSHGLEIEVFKIDLTQDSCRCKPCLDSFIEKSSLFPKLPLSEAIEGVYYERIIDAFMNNLSKWQ